MALQFTVFLKPIVGLFSQSYKLERPDSESKIRFFCGVMRQGLEGPAGTEIGDESILYVRGRWVKEAKQRSNKRSSFLRKAAFFF